MSLQGDALIHEAFIALDVRRRGYLGSREFRRYAELTGYDGGLDFMIFHALSLRFLMLLDVSGRR